MRILADENFPAVAITRLREHGHDVAWVRTDTPGASDRTILKRTERERRVIITFDKDFGELVFRHGLSVASGVILFRIPMFTPDEIANAAIATIQSRDDWTRFFSVVGEDRIRMVPLGKADP